MICIDRHTKKDHAQQYVMSEKMFDKNFSNIFFTNLFEIVWNKAYQSYENKLSAFIGCNIASSMSLKK